MFRPSSLQDLETRADMVVSDVFSEVEGLLKEPVPVPTSGAGVGAEQVRPTRRRATEFVLITGSVFAVGITAVLWWGQLHPPTTAPATVIATGPPAPTTLEQTVLNHYKSETERLANQLRKLPAQPRKDPWLSPRPVAVLAPWAGIAALPLQPPLQNLPALQPLRLPPAPPGTTIQTSTIQIPTSPALTAVPLMVPLPPAPPLAPPVPPTEPVLAGVVEAGGTNPMAIIRIGEQLHNYTPGKEVKDGWLVSQIQSDRVILKRNGQTRSLQLGENP